MSYDLAVFDPLVPPSDRSGFMDWFQKHTKWAEGHSYDDPNICSDALKAWFMDMIQRYPAMNGPYQSDDIDDPNVSDYSLGKAIVYVAFAWSQVEGAHRSAFELAKTHKIGFFDVSADDGQVWMPNSEGRYVHVHGTGCSVVEPGEARTMSVSHVQRKL